MYLDEYESICMMYPLIISLFSRTFCFVVSLIVSWANMDDLVSYAEFSDKEEKRIQKKLAKKMNKM